MEPPQRRGLCEGSAPHRSSCLELSTTNHFVEKSGLRSRVGWNRFSARGRVNCNSPTSCLNERRGAASVACLLVLLIGLIGDPKATGPLQPPTRSLAEAAIYSVLISDSRCSGVGAVGARGRRPVVVRDPVRPQSQWWWNAFPHSDFLEGIPKWLPGIRTETVQSFVADANESPDRRAAVFEELPVDVISRAEVEVLFREGDGWLVFYKGHPAASGLVELSPLGFSADGVEALGYCGRTSESLSGSGFLVHLRHDGQQWRAVSWRQVWQS